MTSLIDLIPANEGLFPAYKYITLDEALGKKLTVDDFTFFTSDKGEGVAIACTDENGKGVKIVTHAITLLTKFRTWDVALGDDDIPDDVTFTIVRRKSTKSSRMLYDIA